MSADSPHFADRLLAASQTKGAPVCVGIDPVYPRLPASIRSDHPATNDGKLQAIERFALIVLDAVAPHVPVVKYQSACFERFGPPGVALLHRLIAAARQRGLLVISDVKRGDIGSTADHYAAATLLPSPVATPPDPLSAADAVTVNPYFGADGLDPFIQLAAAQNSGLFALVRTSNPGGDVIQALMTTTGLTVAEHVAHLVARLGDDPHLLGRSGYSLLGAVVGATKGSEAAELRKIMPRQIFLVPGFGAQGAGADDVRSCFNDDGRGAVITASRSITYAYEKADAGSFVEAIGTAAAEFNRQIAPLVR